MQHYSPNRPQARFSLWLLVAVCGLVGCGASEQAPDGQQDSTAVAGEESSPNASVVAGREVLDKRWDYPWYDDQKDAARRIHVRSYPPWMIRFAGWLRDLFDFRLGNLSWLQWVVWTVVAILLGSLIYWLIRALLRRETGYSDVSTSSAARSAQVARMAALPLDVGAGIDDLLGAARHQYNAGNYAQAILYLFSHKLVELDRSGLIRLARGKTNRQYLREAAKRQGVRDLFLPTMVAFEDVYFGSQPLSRDRFESCWGQLDAFHSLVQQAAV